MLLPLLLLLPADTAVRDDGRRLDGELRLGKSGLLFVPEKGDAPADVVEYRFATSAPPLRTVPGMLLSLHGGQRLSGTPLAIDKEKLSFRTAWSDRIEVPRGAVVSLLHPTGRRPVFFDDFAGKLDGRALEGEPKIADAAVVLNKPGQSLTYKLAKPIEAGRVGVNVHEKDSPAGARWVAEAAFGGKAARVIRVSLGEGKSWSVDAGGLEGTAGDVKRSGDLRRLLIDFSAGSLRVTIDDDVLWHTLEAGPGGSLASVRIACIDLEKPEKSTGGVAFSAFAVERAVRERPHPAGDAKQDELWLADGDQLFGKFTGDGRGVEVTGRYGTKRYAWADLRGVFLRQGEKPAAAKAPAVRVGIRGGLCAEDDILEGTLTDLGAKQLKLQHPSLGILTLPRRRVAWLRPVGK